MTMPDTPELPPTDLPEPFACFQRNPGWKNWEEVIRSAAGEKGVVSAYTADQVRAAILADRATRLAAAPPALHPNHLPDLRYVLKVLDDVRTLALPAEDALQGDVAAAINGMRYIIKRTEEARAAPDAAPAASSPEAADERASEPTDAMVDAYLRANDAYWKRTDELPTAPDKWRTGSPREATRESLRAVFALASAPAGAEGASRDTERLCWALRQFVSLKPVGDECRLLFKVGSQSFWIGIEPLPEDEAAHFAGMFVLALSGAVRAALAGEPAVAADEGRDKALRDAATSLETIAALAGRKTYGDPPIETYMDTFMDVRLYAAARAKVAREALSAQDEQQEKQ